MEKREIITLEINGCSVPIYADQEEIYREVLADKWIDGNRVYVKDGKVHVDFDPTKDGMSLDAMEAMLLDENNKHFALLGRYTQDYTVTDSLFVYDEERKTIHSTDDPTPITLYRAMEMLCTEDPWSNKYNMVELSKMFPTLTALQFRIMTIMITARCIENLYWVHRDYLEEILMESDKDLADKEIADLLDREILSSKFEEGPDGPVQYLRYTQAFDRFIYHAGIHRIVPGGTPFGHIEE